MKRKTLSLLVAGLWLSQAALAAQTTQTTTTAVVPAATVPATTMPASTTTTSTSVPASSTSMPASSTTVSTTTPAGTTTVPAVTSSTPGASTTVTVSSPASSTHAAAMTQQDKLSYTIGVDMAKNLQQQQLTINPDLLAQGMKDVFTNAPLMLTQDQMDQTLRDFQQQMMSKQKTQFDQTSKDNAAKGAAFLAKNKTAAGVVSLPNGLQYKVISAGNGASPSDNDTVTVDYEGTLIDGTVFDSTYKRGKPASFKVAQVIPGWQQALKMMKPGAEWMLYIPSNLAYGSSGVGGAIGPNETLVFKVHLISVAPANA